MENGLREYSKFKSRCLHSRYDVGPSRLCLLCARNQEQRGKAHEQI